VRDASVARDNSQFASVGGDKQASARGRATRRRPAGA
jgi:hypothetical protein